MEQAVKEPARKPANSRGAIAICVVAGALGFLMCVHAVVSGMRSLQEDERIDAIEIDDRTPAELEVDRLLHETEQLETEKAQLRRECVELEERLHALSRRAPRMPAIDTTVDQCAAHETSLFVRLKVGSLDHVEKGFQFSITREKKFVARVVVVEVAEHACVCRVLVLKDGERILEGDVAGTRLD